MKIMIASDIHGSTYYAGEMLKRFAYEKAEKLVLLGDLYYTNFETYNEDENDEMTLHGMLNAYAEKILAIRGNCDSSMDEMISNFPFVEIEYMYIGDKKICFTHGNKYNITNPPPNFGDALIYGHLHEGFIIKEDGKVFANAGSVACPRHGSTNSYLIIEDDKIELKDIDGNIIKQEKL